MKVIVLDKKYYIRNSLVWIIYALYLFIFDPIKGSAVVNIVGISLNITNDMLVYYSLSLFIFPKYWNKNHISFFILYITLFLIAFSIAYSNKYIIRPILKGDEVLFNFPRRMFPMSIIVYIVISGFALSFYLNRLRLYKMKTQNEKEKSSLLFEYDVLKSKLSPHIIFNFLNYCYSQIHKKSKEVADVIEIYSELLRFSIEMKPEKKISLKKEIAYIENYILLKKKLNEKICVKFKTEGIFDRVFIAPRLLITFVENALKHGISTYPYNPIEIFLVVKEHTLYFSVLNTINTNKTIKSTHTGLKNVEQNLNINYPKNFELKNTITDNKYLVEVKINLAYERKDRNVYDLASSNI